MIIETNPTVSIKMPLEIVRKQLTIFQKYQANKQHQVVLYERKTVTIQNG